MTIVSPEEPYLQIIESQTPFDGRYSEVKRIDANGGIGVFSLVFTARDLTTDKIVAIKFFHPLKTTDSYRLACFRRESEILAAFQGQPDIVQLVQGATDTTVHANVAGLSSIGLPFLYHVTELADSNLGKYIYGANRSAQRSLTLFRTCCRALQRIHARSVVHRDVKPENFLLSASGDLLLADFGTARRVRLGEDPLLDHYLPDFPFRGDGRYTAPELLFGAEDHDYAFRTGRFLFSWSRSF